MSVTVVVIIECSVTADVGWDLAELARSVIVREREPRPSAVFTLIGRTKPSQGASLFFFLAPQGTCGFCGVYMLCPAPCCISNTLSFSFNFPIHCRFFFNIIMLFYVIICFLPEHSWAVRVGLVSRAYPLIVYESYSHV